MKKTLNFISATDQTEPEVEKPHKAKGIPELSLDLTSNFSLEDEPEHSPVYISPRHQNKNSFLASTVEPNLPSIQISPLQTYSPQATRAVSLFPFNSPSDFQEKISATTRITTSSYDEIKFTENDYKCVPGKIYCESCGENVFTQIFCRNAQEGFWGKIMCSICLHGMKMNFQEIVHVCLECGSEVAKIKIKKESSFLN
ncbi:hypothetical protein SteCoe_34028 [Stentor coeruleus]|uniref:Uncharacterized protein n=1 Tax=Stentor coeruleus TaxID=5963 RepID=A0A1R2AVE7_9CILI|nr:hypothetical protein SteCoe_34028 [Stentor coeruleus]